MCLDIVYKLVSSPVGGTLDYINQGTLRADSINYIRNKSPIEHAACGALAGYLAYKAYQDYVLNNDYSNFHHLRGSDHNNTIVGEVNDSISD